MLMQSFTVFFNLATCIEGPYTCRSYSNRLFLESCCIYMYLCSSQSVSDKNVAIYVMSEHIRNKSHSFNMKLVYSQT